MEWNFYLFTPFMNSISMSYYQSKKDSIVCRNQTDIILPDSMITEAYQLSIDLIIQSISGQYYANQSTYPSSTYYGSALLVFEDALSPRIEIYQPRTRIYEGRVSEAFAMWEAFRSYQPTYEYFVQVLLPAASDPEGVPKYWKEETEYIALPIREITFQPVGDIQFSLEFAWETPLPFTTPDGILHNGKNGKKNELKGNGLPQNGIQPYKQPDASNPFAGLPPKTSDSDLGIKGYLNGKGLLNSIDPNNVASFGYYLKVTATFKIDSQNCLQKTRVYFYNIQASDTSFHTAEWQPDTVLCGTLHQALNLIANNSGIIDHFYCLGGLQWEVIRAASKPMDYFL